MNLSEAQFHNILADLIESNPFACRASLAISDIRFSTKVPSASVSLKRRPVLSVNLDFVNKHCSTEQHVQALLIHEFLHVLLRHTFEIRRLTTIVNIALDAIINGMIHRKLGETYSSLMTTYYANAKGILVILRPPSFIGDFDRLDHETFRIWSQAYWGGIQYSDVVEFLKGRSLSRLEKLLAQGDTILLGNHDEENILDPDDLPEFIRKNLSDTLRQLSRDGIIPGNTFPPPGTLEVPPATDQASLNWKRQTSSLLKKLLSPNPDNTVRSPSPANAQLPILSHSDRRGVLRSLWNPILADMSWNLSKPSPKQAALIYLDVSGSMTTELELLVSLLLRLGSIIQRPFFAFSTKVHPAEFRKGQLQTLSTGGTLIGPVVDHINRIKPKTALVITDGFLEPLTPLQFNTPHTRVHVLLTPNGSTQELANSTWPIHALPPL